MRDMKDAVDIVVGLKAGGVPPSAALELVESGTPWGQEGYYDVEPTEVAHHLRQGVALEGGERQGAASAAGTRNVGGVGQRRCRQGGWQGESGVEEAGDGLADRCADGHAFGVEHCCVGWADDGCEDDGGLGDLVGSKHDEAIREVGYEPCVGKARGR